MQQQANEMSVKGKYISKISRPKRAVDHVSWRGANDFTWYLVLQLYGEVNSVKNTTINIWLNEGIY